MGFIKKIFLILLVLILSIVVLVYMDFKQSFDRKFALSQPLDYTLEKGSSIHTLANDLHSLNLIDNPVYLVVYARLKGQAQKIQAGEYRLSAEMNLYDLLDNMIAGKVTQQSITIIEGWTFKQLLQTLHQHPAIVNTLKNDTSSVMKQITASDIHPEGRFFPSTYSFTRNTTDIEFLKRAYQKMETTLNKEWQNRVDKLPLKSPYEALILASIIEKETGAADERKLIASVFINRLRKGMRLQTDPTVIYGLGEEYDGDIRFRDLRADTPYNTYTRSGLPPTPIALPGAESIHAALNPAISPLYYFVAIGDGRHKFSVTLDEHEAAVDQYQRKLRPTNTAKKK